jgi:hypothetical protein
MGGVSDIKKTAALLLIYQLALPLGATALFAVTGSLTHPLALSIVLLLAAPSVTGAPNFTIMLRHDPAPALRLLVLGTAIFPLTVLPILWLMPGLGNAGEILALASRLFAVIATAVGAGFALRVWPVKSMTPALQDSLDGAAAILLAVVVVGLMTAIGPALSTDPAQLALWLGAALMVNLGLQTAAWAILGKSPATPARSVVAGNRNIALFLVALPEAVTGPILIFIGCYQVPMYLTPILMRSIYGPGQESDPSYRG